jgi:hypothetical protein
MFDKTTYNQQGDSRFRGNDEAMKGWGEAARHTMIIFICEPCRFFLFNLGTVIPAEAGICMGLVFAFWKRLKTGLRKATT